MVRRQLAAFALHALGIRLLRVFRRPVGAMARERCGRDVVFRFLTEPEARSAFAADAALGIPQPFVRGAYARGDACMAALEGERVLGYAWLSIGRSPHASGLWIEAHAGSGYVYDVFVRPECRGQRIAPWLYVALDRYLTQHGRRAVLSAIDWDNARSARAALRAGARECGAVVLLRLFGAHLAWCSHAAKDGGLRFARPRRARASMRSAGPATAIR
jgi:GNAT superfamily N-acetyltransferase